MQDVAVPKYTSQSAQDFLLNRNSKVQQMCSEIAVCFHLILVMDVSNVWLSENGSKYKGI